MLFPVMYGARTSLKQKVLIRLKEKPFPQEDCVALEHVAEKLHSKIKPSAVLSACTADPA